MTVSILIPIYDPQILFKSFLLQGMKSISKQTLVPSKVYLFGRCLPNYVYEVSERYSKNFPVQILSNNSNGASQNLNYISKLIETKFTKILFQDDFLIEPTYLERINESLQDHVWIATSSRHYEEDEGKFSRTIRPRFSRGLRHGINTIGSPSAIALRSDSILRFDERLVYAYDCDWYLRMRRVFGKPGICSEINVGIRIHKEQTSHRVYNQLKREVAIMKSKHPTILNKVRTNIF